jgi:hypothetical protein
MSIYLFLTFTLLHRVLCDLSCYQCDLGGISFNYTVTAENISTQLNNCSIVIDQWYCVAEITWQRNPVKSNIMLRGYENLKSSGIAHTLWANIYAPYDPFRPGVRNAITYTCLTDKCNNPANLKFLLEFLTLTDKFEELEYLLESNEPFDGRRCLLFSNSTVSQPNSTSTIDPATCDQCSTDVQNTPELKQIVATCVVDSRLSNKLVYAAKFDISSRTRSTSWRIDCQRPDCNSLSTGDRI